MAFERKFLSRVGGSGESNAIWIYASTEAVADVLAANFFDHLFEALQSDTSRFALCPNDPGMLRGLIRDVGAAVMRSAKPLRFLFLLLFKVLCPIGHNKYRLCLEFRRVSWRV